MTISMGGVRAAWVLLAAVALAQSALRAETLEDAEKAIAAKFSQITSATYDTEMSSMSDGQGYKMNMSSTAKNEMMRSGDKMLIRMEAKTSNDMVVAGNSTKTDSMSTMVEDGEFAWTVTDTNGQKSVMKTNGKAFTENSGGAGLFKMLGEHYTLALLPDETVDGNAAYVIECKPKQVAGQASKYYFDKSSGMLLQTLSASTDGKMKTTVKVTNVKTNVALGADHFKFTPPAGVQVMDMTKQ